MKKLVLGLIIASGVQSMALSAENKPAVSHDSASWYEKCGAAEIKITSSLDKTQQPAIFVKSDSAAPAPLLVSLHTWSFTTLNQDYTNRVEWCRMHKWNYIQPDFRGANNKPAAMGSDLAVQDIVDAVNYAKEHSNVDPNRIYLIGASGGGHMALLMAGRHPEIWAGVSAWCPISDLKAWHDFSASKKSKYATDIELSAGGNPDTDPKALAECVNRSPVTHLAKAAGVNIDIGTGIHDGYTGSVPVSHAFIAFNTVVGTAAAVAMSDIDYICRNQAVPDKLKSQWKDATYAREIHFRKIAGNTRLTIFEGGHEEVESASLPWLDKQRKNQKAVWDVPPMKGASDTVQVTR